MSDYSIVNLKEIDDSDVDKAPNLEAHFGRTHIDSEHLGVSHFHYNAGLSARRWATPTTVSRRRSTSSSTVPAASSYE